MLVQAAWSYRLPPRSGTLLRKRQEGQAAQVIAHCWKAQHRLHRVFTRLVFRKNSPIAATAVARELAGFVWALMQDVDSKTHTNESKAASGLSSLSHTNLGGG